MRCVCADKKDAHAQVKMRYLQLLLFVILLWRHTYVCLSVCLSVCMSNYLYLMFFSLLALLSYPCLCRVGVGVRVSV